MEGLRKSNQDCYRFSFNCGKVVWENGEWSGTFFLQGEDCGPHQVRVYFASINVREGNTWRVCMSTFSISPQRPTTTQ